jgi:dihydrofolate reductase
MIVCIVAVERKQGIGFNGSMPWPHLSEDMRWFSDTTKNNVVVMGSTTWKSIGKSLPDRINVVISSTLHADATHTYDDPVEAVKDLAKRYSNKNIFIIGGQKVYDATKHLAEKFQVTEIDADYECDRFFDLEFVTQKFKQVEELFTIESTDKEPKYTVKEYTR